MFTGNSYILNLIPLLFILTSNIFAQGNEVRHNSYFYPDTKKDNRIIHTVGLSTAELPEDIVETEGLIRAPLFYYRLKYHLPANTYLEGTAESNIITYSAAIGPGWNFNSGNFGLSIGADSRIWYGYLKTEGFNTDIYGWRLYPNFSMGINFPNFTLTLRTELMIILEQVTEVGTITERNDFDTFSGYSFSLFLEQPLWKNNYIVLGLKFNFTKFYSPLWAAFPTFDRYVYISEIIIGYNL